MESEDTTVQFSRTGSVGMVALEMVTRGATEVCSRRQTMGSLKFNMKLNIMNLRSFLTHIVYPGQRRAILHLSYLAHFADSVLMTSWLWQQQGY